EGGPPFGPSSLGLLPPLLRCDRKRANPCARFRAENRRNGSDQPELQSPLLVGVPSGGAAPRRATQSLSGHWPTHGQGGTRAVRQIPSHAQQLEARTALFPDSCEMRDDLGLAARAVAASFQPAEARQFGNLPPQLWPEVLSLTAG